MTTTIASLPTRDELDLLVQEAAQLLSVLDEIAVKFRMLDDERYEYRSVANRDAYGNALAWTSSMRDVLSDLSESVAEIEKRTRVLYEGGIDLDAVQKLHAARLRARLER